MNIIDKGEENALRSWGEGIVRTMKERLEEKGDIVPMIHALTTYREILIIATPWKDQEEKDLMLWRIQQLFLVEEVVAYAQMAEAWKSQQMKGDPFVQPHKSSNKTEAVVCNLVSKHFIVRFLSDLERDWKTGKYLRLVNEEWETINTRDNPGYYGDMAELFPTDVLKFSFNILSPEKKQELKDIFYGQLGNLFQIGRRKLNDDEGPQVSQTPKNPAKGTKET